MDARPDLGDAALAVGATAVVLAAIPVRAAARLPGMGRLAADGAIVRARVRSRLEGLLDEVLASPEIERAVDRMIAGRLPDAVVSSLVEHRVPERIAVDLAERVDIETAVAAALDHETMQRIVGAVLASPGFDRMLVQATDRALNGPEMQRVVEHVAASPEVRAALARQSTTLAEELVTGMRTRAEALDDVAERTVRGWLRRPRPA